jgi:transcriptional regulator with XRE-family HTH domain
MPAAKALAATPKPKTLAEWLALPGAGRSQRKLAAKVGCHQSMISMLVKGQRAARGKLALALAEETELPVEQFLIPHSPSDDE